MKNHDRDNFIFGGNRENRNVMSSAPLMMSGSLDAFLRQVLMSLRKNFQRGWTGWRNGTKDFRQFRSSESRAGRPAPPQFRALAIGLNSRKRKHSYVETLKLIRKRCGRELARDWLLWLIKGLERLTAHTSSALRTRSAPC